MSFVVMNDLYALEEDEKDFSYDKESDVGPKHWGRLHKEWETCGKGQLQSPIDLSNKRVQVLDNLGDIRHTYKPNNAIMKNRGHDIMVIFFFFLYSSMIQNVFLVFKIIHDILILKKFDQLIGKLCYHFHVNSENRCIE